MLNVDDKHKLHGDLDDDKCSTYCAALPGRIPFIFDIKTIVLKGENVKIPTSFQPHRCRRTAADSALITQSQYILRKKKSTTALLCEGGPTLSFTTGSEQRANHSGTAPVIRVIPAHFYHILSSFICDF